MPFFKEKRVSSGQFGNTEKYKKRIMAVRRMNTRREYIMDQVLLFELTKQVEKEENRL